jgi:predicted CDP-diglyceride synthetase/phosphatidate cytidylyltransferase
MVIKKMHPSNTEIALFGGILTSIIAYFLRLNIPQDWMDKVVWAFLTSAIGGAGSLVGKELLKLIWRGVKSFYYILKLNYQKVRFIHHIFKNRRK